MKIAYMVLAHTDPPQLQRLVSALKGEHAFLFIHIDKKADARQFMAAVNKEANAQFVTPRITVNPGGFSMIRATLALMKQALNCGKSFDYLILLSGSHYPIKDNQRILDFLERHREREFIRYVDIREASFLEYRIKRIRLYDHRMVDLVTRALRRATRVAGLGKASSLLFEREFPGGFIPYAGSQWWGLTRDCATYVMDFIDAHPEFIDFYRFTTIPDEMFFQTIIMNSDFARRTNQNADYSYWRDWGRKMYPVKVGGDQLTYVDWSLDREDPAILDERDFVAMAQSECLFARKFTSTKSLNLIAQIDRYLLKRGRGADG
jgi:hypothetical protein